MKHNCSRFVGFLLAAAFFLITETLSGVCVYAQGISQQSKYVTIKGVDIPIKEVMSSIEEQTNYLFIYSKDVDLDRKLSVSLENARLEDALQTVFGGVGLSYSINGSNITVKPRTVASTGIQTVSGVVKDNSDTPVIGAYVLINGTQNGSLTDLDGKYSVKIPAETLSPVLKVTCMGYQTVEENVAGRAIINFTLQDESVNLESSVVTALGIRRSEKALNYNVQQLNSDAINTVKDPNFVNSLNGRIAGVTINASSSGVGGESKVVMRGTKSISQSSNALYVIDGVPVYSAENYGETGMGSRGRSDAMADINSEDIESISVLTGAAAAALYGSQAANGAIVITTKKGSKDKTTLSVSSNTEVTQPVLYYQFQNRYGNNAGEATSWGKLLPENYRFNYNPATDYLQNGVISNVNVNFSTGNERNQTFASAGAVNSMGNIPNNAYNKYSVTFRNTSSFVKDKLHLDVSAQYIRQNDRNMINQGVYLNPLVGAYLYPRGENWDYCRTYEQYSATRKLSLQNWPWMKLGGVEWDNPYWLNNRVLRTDNKNRFLVSGGLTWDILDWLKLAGRARMDYTSNQYEDKRYASTNTTLTDGSANGFYQTEDAVDRQIYADVLLMINKSFGENWTLNANIGASISDIYSYTLYNGGAIRSDGLPNMFTIAQLDRNVASFKQTSWREQSQSVFASVEVGFKGAYYLTLTGRNDWPSQLAGPHSNKSSFFYPSVGGSVVLNQAIPGMPLWIDLLKVRGSWASVGLPFKRFIANPGYAWNEATGAWETSKVFPLYDLKPEKTNSWEIGATFKAKGFSLDISYYDALTFNQTFDSKLSVSSGYTTLYVQTGSVRNNGIELALGYEHTWGNFGWNTNFTFSHNHNKIEALMDDYTHPETGAKISLSELNVGGKGNANFILRPGGTLGDLYTNIDLNRDANGDILIDRNGNISRDNNTGYRFLGSVFPTANMGWNNTFNFFGVQVGFLISARIGGIVYSATQAYLENFGVAETTAVARDNGGIHLGRFTIPAQNYYTVIGSQNGIPQFYTYDATNVRLQEAHIGYTIPRKVLGNVCDLNISVIGRNLWMIYCKAPFDPESVASAGNYYQGIDYFMLPSTRNVGLSLRLTF